ncbi:MAG: hypothetical protein WCV50_02915 [Patescibacteria group bacterium]|jgi:hypothetical protein
MPNNLPREQETNQPKKIEDIFDLEKKSGSELPEIKPTPESQPERKVEVKPEVQHESKPEAQPEAEASRRQYAPQPVQQPAVTTPIVKSEDFVHIETILSDHLDNIFLQMDPQQQMEFSRKGEETAGKLEVIIQQTKIKVKEILNLIRDWLRLVPGINKFFLEQEVKIKADRIINLHEKKHIQK